jgi:DNA-binding transcriptional ArsR family regulator
MTAPDLLDPGDDDSAHAGFEVLSEPLRLDILRALARRVRDEPDDPVVGFADLRRAVGSPDSGNFNYHLEKLTGRFARRTDEGYHITAAGMQVIAAVSVGVYGEERQMGPTDLPDPCPVCAATLTATYDAGLLEVTCPNDHEFRHPLPPGAIDERSLEEVIELFWLRTRQTLERAVEGVCPFCYASLSWAVDTEFDDDQPSFQNQCERCGARLWVPAFALLLTHPTAIVCYHDHGIDIRRRALWAPEFYDNLRVTVESTDPVRVAVSLDVADERLVALVDADLTIRDIERRPRD